MHSTLTCAYTLIIFPEVIIIPRHRHDTADTASCSQGTADADQTPCAQGTWCRGYRIEGTQRLPALTPRAFCDPCERHIAQCLDELPEMYHALDGEAGEKSGTPERVSGSRTPPVPVRLDVDALKREYIAVLASWDERVRDTAGRWHPGTETARHRRDMVAVALCVQTLAVNLAVLLALPAAPMTRAVRIEDVRDDDTGMVHVAAEWAEVVRDLSGTDAAVEIIALHGRARHILGHFLEREEMGAPCPRCDSLTLVRTAGENRISCTMCRHAPDEDEYARWAALLAHGAWYINHMNGKLAALLALPAGWDGQRARKVTPAAAAAVHEVIVAVMRPEFMPPAYFPLPDGGIQAEWAAGDTITVVTDPDGQTTVVAVRADGETAAEGPWQEHAPVLRDMLEAMSRRSGLARLPGVSARQAG
jgi:hypothetical protein